MRLDLLRWAQRRQDDASFLVTIAFTKELFDALEGVPDQLGGVLGRYREGTGHAIGVLRLICKNDSS